MSEAPLLEFKNVTHIFRVGGLISRRRIKAVDDVSFTIPSEKPMIKALVGESGSGKTTIARIILGLLEPTSGEVLYKGRRIKDWLKKEKTTYLREVQPIFQDPYSIYNPFYRVERVLKLALKKLAKKKSKKEIEDEIISAMKDIGLRPEDILGRYPHQLSGGERQRLMLCRILLIRPKLVIADEPVSMIDVSLRAIFLEHLSSFKEKIGTSCLYITHDLNIAGYIADEIMVLAHGCLVEEGPTKDLIGDPLHPYTKLLVNSIPNPNPRKRWKEKMSLSSEFATLEQVKVEHGCIFHPRCPYATEKCKKEKPPMIEVKPKRKVSCFLYT
ncbi:ABC transporter ATP-binding protein [Candidatus Bathyarchaeota archaeon]|nr:ABC transporter ATP-binding protein [Candidatus Bathyarchaeota archaeon]